MFVPVNVLFTLTFLEGFEVELFTEFMHDPCIKKNLKKSIKIWVPMCPWCMWMLSPVYDFKAHKKLISNKYICFSSLEAANFMNLC